MGKKKNGTYNGNKQEEQLVENLIRRLTRKKTPGALAVLICIAAVLYGVQGKAPSGRTDIRQTAQQENGAEAPRYSFRSQEQMEDHFERHGIEMGYPDAQAYVAGANRVIGSPEALHKLEAEDGDDVYYLEDTNEFVIVSTKGYIRTYFEPEDGLAYYERQ